MAEKKTKKKPGPPKGTMPKHPVRATPSQKRTEANRRNAEKSRFSMKGREASRNSPVKRDLPEDIIDSRIQTLLTRQFVSRVLSQYALSTLSEVQKAANNSKLSMIERIACKILIKAWKNEDIFRLEFILQRTIGKVSDKLEIVHDESIQSMTTEDLKAEHARLSQKNLETIRAIEKAEVDRRTIELSLSDYKYKDVDGAENETIIVEGDDDQRTH